MAQQRRSGFQLIYLLVFLSGISGLIYEIVWIRALGRHFGTTAPAISTVLAAFMGGLALGNLLIGRRADRTPRPFVLYRWLELGIAASGLLVSMLLLHGDPILGAVARATDATGSLAGVIRFLVFTGQLIVPATLMGGTLPVLARALTRAGASGQVIGALYATNTIGAVFGVLLPDLLLVPFAGLTAAVLVAVALNLLVALGASRLSATQAPEPLPEEAPGRADHRATILYAVSGFCAMGFEILWSRVMEHWNASFVTMFSMLLGVFLLMLSIGSWVVRRFADRVRNPLAWAASLLALLGPAVMVPLALASWWMDVVARINPAPEAFRPPLVHGIITAALHALWLEGAACLIMGAAFPFLAAATIRAGAAGRQTGNLYAVNTVAGVFGSVLTGFFILPILGQQTGFLVLTILSGAVGLAMVIHLFRSGPRFLGVAAAAAAATLVINIALPADHINDLDFSWREGTLLVMREGPTTTVCVRRHDRFGAQAYLELATPGVSMSDSRFGAQRYMGLMGHLGVFFAREPRTGLLICYGIGTTARALLSHSDLERLDVVDISPEVFAVAPWFESVHGGQPLQDPRAVSIVDDGRHHLVVTDRRYDVITSEPPPPNHAGVVNLYSREYYRTAKTRLRPGGVLTQWLPVFQVSRGEAEAIVAAFTAEFDHVALLYGYEYHWILAGSDAPLSIDLEAWRARVDLPTVKADLERIGVDGVGDLVATVIQGDAGLREATRDWEPVTDNFPVIQYPWPAIIGPDVPAGLVGEPLQVRDMIQPPPSPEAWAALLPAIETTRRIQQVLDLSGLLPVELWELMYGSALRSALGERLEHTATLALLEAGDDVVALARAALASGEMDPEALGVLVRRDFYSRRYTRALAAMEAAGPGIFPAAQYWLLRGGCLRALGRPEEAVDAFRTAMAASERPDFRRSLERLILAVHEPFRPEVGPVFPPLL